MGYPRSFLVDPLVSGVYHSPSRCVCRQSLLKSPERCAWLVRRFELLASAFAIDVCDFAVMRNHVHLLLRTHPELAFAWSDEEVVRRWLAIATLADDNREAEPDRDDIDEALKTPTLIAEWRSRLSDLGWFHKRWKEPAAKTWNREDEVTGHFWEGRYKSVGCADEGAILMQATYILLNPVHCGLEAEIVDSPHTSTGRRLKALMRSIEAGELRGGVAAYQAALLEPAIPCVPGTEVRGMSDAEWSRRLAERTYERALRENAVEEARRAADLARRFDGKALEAEAGDRASIGPQAGEASPDASATREPDAAAVSAPASAPAPAPVPAPAPARLLAPGARRLRSTAPTLPKRRLPDPPSSGNLPSKANPWRERSTLPLTDGCTLLAFIELLDDRGRVERPDKRGRIGPTAPRVVERLLAKAGMSARGTRPKRSRWTRPVASRDTATIAEACALLDEAESRIREILSSATGPPGIAWRGTIVGSAGEPDSEPEAEGRIAFRAEALRPIASRIAMKRAS